MYAQSSSCYFIDAHIDYNQSSLQQNSFVNAPYFNDEKQDELKATGHSNIHNEQEIERDLPVIMQNKENKQKPAHRVSVIQCQANKLFKIHKSKKGRSKQTKNILQIFKSETLFYLTMLIDFKILTFQDRFRVEKFKQETTSAVSFGSLFQSKLIKQKTIQFFHSPEFVKRIMKSDRLVNSRKIEVLKNIDIFTNLLFQVSVQ